MRFAIPIPCPGMQAQAASASGPATPQVVVVVGYHDSPVYEAECSAGHKLVMILQEQKFEILFQIGAFALLDGYYREAVSSFTSSMERFHEFAIRCFLLHDSVPEAQVTAVWSEVSNQSERQLGASSSFG